MKEDNKVGRDLFIKFASEIKNSNRFFIDDTFSELFLRILEQHQYEIKRNTVLFRGRINPKSITTPYVNDDIGMPKSSSVSSQGRANPIGINYMYLANNINTVIAELRPNIDDFISIGKFTTNSKLKIIKFGNSAWISGTINDKWSSSIISSFMMYLVLAFSSPVDRRSSELEYLPSQYFAEYCKMQGLDGIMYLSSVMNKNASKPNYNYVLFNDQNVTFQETNVHVINGIKYNSKNMITSDNTPF